MLDNTRMLRDGDIFLLSPGENFSTEELLLLAEKKFPSALVADNSEKKFLTHWFEKKYKHYSEPLMDVYYLESLKELSGFLTSAFYDYPSKKIKVCAITGTNGKTTVVNAAALAFAGFEEACASMGTLGLIVYRKDIDSIQKQKIFDFELTTPSAALLQWFLQKLSKDGVKRLFLEASSIGIVQGRMLGCEIRNAALTNITDDHIEYHGSKENLESAKTLLFTIPNLESAVFLNSDRQKKRIYEKISKKLSPHVNTVLVSVQSNKKNSDINLKINSASEDSTVVDYESDARNIMGVKVPAIGKHNIENAAIVAGLMFASGKSSEEIVFGLKEFETPPGRMDFLKSKNCPLVCIDYAHTPDALMHILKTLRPQSRARKGKLFCVFGCGGGRDKMKRSQMGRVVAEFCDGGFVTSDNPRFENVEKISEETIEGIETKHRDRWKIINDRSKAIHYSILNANKNDVILIAGKGNEKYQLIKSKKIPFSDYLEVQSAFEKRKIN